MGFLDGTIFGGGGVRQSEFEGPKAWLEDTHGFGAHWHSSSGLTITDTNMLTLSAVFAAVRALSEDIAKLPLKLYRRLDRGKEVARDDPRYELLHLSPNPEMNAFDFRCALMANAIMWHGGFAEIERGQGGMPRALWPILASRVMIRRDDNKELYYEVTGNQDEETRDIAQRDMIHVKGFGDTGLAGFLMARVAGESLGVYMAAERFSAEFFSHGTTSSAVITFPGKLSNPDYYQQHIEKNYAGLGQRHRAMILDQDAKVTSAGTDAEKSQLNETLQFRVEDVARWFRVPPHKLQHLLRATFSNIEQQSLEYILDSQMPWLVRSEQEFTRKLISGRRRTQLFFEHVIDATMRADMKSRFDAYSIGIQNGIFNRNEVREKENLNPYTGGDRFVMQQNMAEIDENGRVHQMSEPEPDQPEDDGNAPDDESDSGSQSVEQAKTMMMPVFADAAKRIIAREAKALQNCRQVNEQWLNEFYAGHRGAVRNMVAPAIQTLGQLVGVEYETIADRYADMHVGESRREIEHAASIEELTRDWEDNRVPWIAQYLTDEVAHAGT